MKGTVLIVEDEAGLRRTLAEILAARGFHVVEAADGVEGLEQVERSCPLLVFTDWKMPRMDGIEFLRELRARPEHRDTPVVVITAFASSHTAIEASKYGAFDFLTKPCDLADIQRIADRATAYARLHQETRTQRAAEPVVEAVGGMIGNSKPMLEVFKLIGRAAQTDSTVLIRGESGTGKELVANAIHRYSPRAGQRFVAVNSAALSETLLESELFGHERGAFTGAAVRRQGRFELAHRGTIFLDEIGDISPNMQTKLLRVLEERSFERVGGAETLSVDVRVIAATNRDLEKAVAEGHFRSDLYYRLNVLTIPLPPLRERREDIRSLAEHFLARYSQAKGGPAASFSEDALQLLQQYSYPGNVRELENIVQQGASLITGRIVTADHLRPLLGGSLDLGSIQLLELPFHEAVAELERLLLARALNQSGQNKSEAARRLGITRRLLYKKMREFSLGDVESLPAEDEPINE
jgi:DNA-binding NtrC family response regulator